LNSDVNAPIAPSTVALAATLATIALRSASHTNGTMGKIAPPDVAAALHGLPPGAGDTHHEAEVRHQAVVCTEHGGAQVVSGCTAMPRLCACDVGAGDARRPAAPSDRLHDRCVSALVRRQRQRVGLIRILVAVGELGSGNRRQFVAQVGSVSFDVAVHVGSSRFDIRRSRSMLVAGLAIFVTQSSASGVERPSQRSD
jgi:hypothetical protein